MNTNDQLSIHSQLKNVGKITGIITWENYENIAKAIINYTKNNSLELINYNSSATFYKNRTIRMVDIVEYNLECYLNFYTTYRGHKVSVNIIYKCRRDNHYYKIRPIIVITQDPKMPRNCYIRNGVIDKVLHKCL